MWASEADGGGSPWISDPPPSNTAEVKLPQYDVDEQDVTRSLEDGSSHS